MPRGFRFVVFLGFAFTMYCFTGCPEPSKPIVNRAEAPETETVETPAAIADDKEAVSALEKSGALLKKNEAGTVVESVCDPGTDEQLSFVAKLPSVVKLVARGPGVTDKGLVYLKDHKSLKNLDLTRADFEDPGLENLVAVPLEDINLELTNVTDPGVATLAKIASLKRLKLVKTKVTNDGIAHLKALPNLEVLDLQDVVTVGNPCLETVKGFQKLKFLRIYGNGFKDQGIEPIGTIKSLKALSMEQTVVKDDNVKLLKDLVNLEKLALFGTFVSDKGMAELSGLTKLVELELRDTTVGAGGSPMDFLKNYPELKLLDLSETGTRNEAIPNIVALKKLEKLYLWHSQVTDAGVKELEAATTLTYLNLDDIRVGDAAMESVGKLTNLTFLHIGKTDVTDAGLEKLYPLKKLEKIHLSNLVNVTDEGIAKLQEAIPALKKPSAIVR